MPSLPSHTLYHISEALYPSVLPKSELKSRGLQWFALGYPWNRIQKTDGTLEDWILSLQSYYMSVLIFLLRLLKICIFTHYHSIFHIALQLAADFLGTLRQSHTCQPETPGICRQVCLSDPSCSWKWETPFLGRDDPAWKPASLLYASKGRATALSLLFFWGNVLCLMWETNTHT